MTTEEKAKAYDEALKNAQYWLNAPQVIEDWNYTVKDIIPNIFPELKESEDDKIRKALIEVAREVAQKQFFINRGTTLEDVIAYLEKQKAKERLDRMAPIYNDKESFESALEKAWKYYNESASRTVDSFEDDYIECVFSKGFREGFLYKEKQKEQKPAEWSEDWREEDIQTRFAFYTYKDDPSVLYLSNVFVEETSRNHGFGTRILRAAEKVAKTVGATTISLKVKQNSHANAWYRKNGYGYVTFEDGYDWLEKSLKYMEPVKQDWSEKDNIMLGNTILCLKEYCFTDEINWLKSFPERFNLQSKHGWRRYIWAVNLCFDYDGLVRYEDNGSYEIVTAGDKPKRQVNGEYILLKDIQLTDWKPSKEQMEVLNEAVGDFRMEDTASCEKTADTLESLYNDLKKLF